MWCTHCSKKKREVTGKKLCSFFSTTSKYGDSPSIKMYFLLSTLKICIAELSMEIDNCNWIHAISTEHSPNTLLGLQTWLYFLFGSLLHRHIDNNVGDTRYNICVLQFLKEEVHFPMALTSSQKCVRSLCDCSLPSISGALHYHIRVHNGCACPPPLL